MIDDSFIDRAIPYPVSRIPCDFKGLTYVQYQVYYVDWSLKGEILKKSLSSLYRLADSERRGVTRVAGRLCPMYVRPRIRHHPCHCASVVGIRDVRKAQDLQPGDKQARTVPRADAVATRDRPPRRTSLMDAGRDEDDGVSCVQIRGQGLCIFRRFLLAAVQA